MQYSLVRCCALAPISLVAVACSSTTASQSEEGASGLATSGPEPPAFLPSSASDAAAASPSQAQAAGRPASTSTLAPQEPEPSNFDERAEAPPINPFVLTDHDPVSTFASDVDTASYDLFARIVSEGDLPAPEQVRIEEFVNYFHYDYPAADFASEVPFSIDLAASPSFLGGDTALLRVGIQGKAPPPEEKKPTNLVFLVDSSGSMQSSDKLPLVQQVLGQTLDLLAPEDTVSIVSYAGDTRVRLAPTPVADRSAIAQQVTALKATGSTDGASGIELAYEQAEQGFVEGGVNHVILCTDGDFNVGVSDTVGLVNLITEKRRSGVTFTALGFGYAPNDAMLEGISNAGNGFYGVITSEQQAAEYVQERMLSTLSLIARDVKLQVEFNADRVSAYRLLGYENRDIADRDFRNDLVDAGEIGANHQVTALYELVLAGGEVPSVSGAPEPEDGNAYEGAVEVSSDDLVLVKVRYKGVDATEQDAALEVSSSLTPAGIAESAEDADLDLRWAAGVAFFSEVLRGSPYAVSEQMDILSELFAEQTARDEDRAAFFELFTLARARM